MPATTRWTVDLHQAGDPDYSNGSAETTFTISPATLTITPTAGQSKVYGAAVPTLTYTASGFVNNDPASTLTGSPGTTATAASSVGNYAFTTGTLNAGNNYTVVLEANAPTFAVTPAPLTVTVTAGQSMTYGAAAPTLAYSYTGLVNGDTSASFSGALATTATSSSNVGGYAITEGTLAATGNYTIGTFNAGTLTVNPAPLTVTVTAGQSMTYGAAVPTLTYSYTGLVNNDTSASFSGALATSATSSSSVGGYAINRGTLAATGNYTIGTFNAGILTVNPAALIITANSASKIFGTSITFSPGAFTETGLVTANGDTITGVTETSTGAAASAAVGNYDIIPSAATGTGLSNYTITYDKGTLTVFPPITVPTTVQTAYENVNQAVSGISIASGLSGSLTLTLGVSHGTLTLRTTSGLTVKGNGTGSVTAVGTTANLNAALASLGYRGSLNYSGSDTLGVTLTDSGITFNASVAITVVSIAQEDAALVAQVNALQEAGVLTATQANTLLADLALRGNHGDVGKIGSCINDVNGYVNSQVLTKAQANALLGSANILLLGLEVEYGG